MQRNKKLVFLTFTIPYWHSCTSCSTKAEVAKKSFWNVYKEQNSVDYNNLKDSWISQCTLQKLSHSQQKITEKEMLQSEHVDIRGKFNISLEERKRITHNRQDYRFKNWYMETVLLHIKDIYNGCVPCIQNHYLRNPNLVLFWKVGDTSYYEGYAQLYCMHKNCCSCEVEMNVKFYSWIDHVDCRAVFLKLFRLAAH